MWRTFAFFHSQFRIFTVLGSSFSRSLHFPHLGFAKFLREVGNRPDAFGSVNFDARNDRIVADDIDQIQKVRQQRPKHRQNKRPKQRRPFASGERRTTYEDEYPDEYEVSKTIFWKTRPVLE